jgi:hypothetical protein
LGRTVAAMAHEPRNLACLALDGRVKHYEPVEV